MAETAKPVTQNEISRVAERLQRAYPYIHVRKVHEGVLSDPPLDSLIRAILSQHTTDVNRDRAFNALKSTYRDWNTIADAPLEELTDIIHFTNHAYTKAQRIQAILHELREQYPEPTLDFLRQWPTEQVIEYLRHFTGVGEKTAAIVCLFSLKRPVMAVDTHVYRVAQRLGWLREQTNPDKAHGILQRLIPCDLILPLHMGLWEHGRVTCRPKPKCAQCAVYEFCIYSEKTAPMPDVSSAITVTSGIERKAA